MKYCSEPRDYTALEKRLQADTAIQNKKIQLLKLEAKSFHARALRAENEVITLKDERVKLKEKVRQKVEQVNKLPLPDSSKIKVSDLINIFEELDSASDKTIEKQDTAIKYFKKTILFKDSIINHLQIKLKDVTGLDSLHVDLLNQVTRRNTWHKIKDWLLPIGALILGILI